MLLVNCLFKLAQENVWMRELTFPAMTIVVDLGRKAIKQTNIYLCTLLLIDLAYFIQTSAIVLPAKRENYVTFCLQLSGIYNRYITCVLILSAR